MPPCRYAAMQRQVKQQLWGRGIRPKLASFGFCPWHRYRQAFAGMGRTWRDQTASENLINCDFQAAVSNEKWLTDITEFQIPAGKVYSRPADQRGIFFVVAATGTFE
jgi:hypothetical protein